MPYLRVTCPHVDNDRRRGVAAALTEAVVEMFTSSAATGVWPSPSFKKDWSGWAPAGREQRVRRRFRSTS